MGGNVMLKQESVSPSKICLHWNKGAVSNEKDQGSTDLLIEQKFSFCGSNYNVLYSVHRSSSVKTVPEAFIITTCNQCYPLSSDKHLLPGLSLCSHRANYHQKLLVSVSLGSSSQRTSLLIRLAVVVTGRYW